MHKQPRQRPEPPPPREDRRRRPHRRRSPLMMCFTIIGFVTVCLLIFRFLIVPVLVMLNGGVR